MKKKIVTMILLVTMICGMAACGQKEETPLNREKEDTTVENNVSEETEQKEEQEENKDTDEEWGTQPKRCYTKNKDGELVGFMISFPEIYRNYESRVMAIRQNEPTIVIMDSVDWEEASPEGLENVLENCDMDTLNVRALGSVFINAFIDDSAKYIEDVDLRSTVSFEAESTELVTINGFPMCKYVGNVVVVGNENTYTLPFAGYAADLQEGDGAWIIWLIVDNTEYDHNKEWYDTGSDIFYPMEEGQIEEYALKMAESLQLRE